MSSVSHIRIFTDGACEPNPGPGAWAAIIRLQDHVIELGGPEPQTTSNRMEIIGVIEALDFVAEIPGEVQLYSDSKYVVQAASSWIQGWKRDNWRKRDGEPVCNQDLMERLDELIARRLHPIRFFHIPGHRGIPGNERCDQIANTLIQTGFSDLRDWPLAEYPYDLNLVEPMLPPSKPRKIWKHQSRSRY